MRMGGEHAEERAHDGRPIAELGRSREAAMLTAPMPACFQLDLLDTRSLQRPRSTAAMSAHACLDPAASLSCNKCCTYRAQEEPNCPNQH